MTNGNDPDKFERCMGRVADFPWGQFVLIVLVVFFLCGKHFDTEDVRAFATAAGLLGVGHGIHTGAKNFANPRTK